MATSPTVPMYAPDGTLGDVPYEHMHEALAAGGKLGVNMIAPDGTHGVIPADRVADAQKAGGKTVPFSLEDADGPKRGFWGQLQDKVSSAVSSAVPKNAEEAKSVGLSILKNALIPGESALEAGPGIAKEIVHQATRPVPADTPGPKSTYRVATTLSSVVPGLNPEAMEKAASKGDTAAVAAETSVPLAVLGAGVGAPKAVAKISDMLPSTERAGAAFKQVKAAAGDVPIDMTKPGNAALELFTQSQRGATLPKVVRDFVNRATKPGADPITYSEAKDFQSNISRLSANERMNLTPNTQRLLGQLNQDLKGSLEGAANTVGKGEAFAKAMKEYHDAMQIQGFTDEAKANALKVGISAGLGGIGLAGAHKLWNMLAP